VRKIRLRTKFLLSLLVISAGLTSATLLIVRYSVQKRVREAIREDLRNSVNTYQGFERQREVALTRSAELLANLPNVRALMTTRDAKTIQDASADIWRLSGSDLLVFADRGGNVLGLRTGTAGFALGTAQELLRHSLEREEARNWWFGGGHLYEVWIQPIYFGQQSEDTTLGFLAVGHEINERAAKDFSNIASSEVAFHCGGTLVASTLTAAQQTELAQQVRGGSENPAGAPQEIQLGSERYLLTTVRLSPDGGPSVSLSVLKSFDKATSFLSELNHILLGLGLLSVLGGSALVFLISHTFTRPLASLVAGVRALEEGDFTYPLESSGGDEVAEVTGAFDRMRVNLEKTQSEHKLLEERLRQAHKMEAVGRLAGGVAHDFNNLLTIIRGHGDLLLERGDADDFERRSIDQIQKAAGRAVSLTRQLLAFSRMQVLQPRVLDLNAIVAEMGKMLPRLIGEDIEYVFQPEPKLALVKADPGQVEQVIMNLAVNARDAMAGGGKLTVRTLNAVVDEAQARKRPPMSPGPYVLLAVTDTGHGMDNKTKARIFEPFFTTKEVGKGTGLGLATVYGVVKQSGGFIWVESTPGEGATFEIYLPQALGAVAEVEAEVKPSAIPRGSETILVVEDEAGVRELACQFLKVSGYSVLEAADGVEALEIAARYAGKIHVMLSDMVMPRMSGGELMERLIAVRPDVKVLLMSGYSEYSSGHPGQGTPQALVLQKPFSLPSLVEKVREVLAGNPVEQVSAGKEHCVK
jgi:two-component system cell cycle sensor histidine kinase/response regulator CckA